MRTGFFEHAFEFLRSNLVHAFLFDSLLKRDFFHRAKKITVKRIGGREDGDDGSVAGGQQQFSETENSPSVSPRAKQQDKKKQQQQKQLLQQQQAEESGQETKKERRKKKIKLEWHPTQRFLDGKEAYVWLYEPTSISQIVYGSLIGATTFAPAVLYDSKPDFCTSYCFCFKSFLQCWALSVFACFHSGRQSFARVSTIWH